MKDGKMKRVTFRLGFLAVAVLFGSCLAPSAFAGSQTVIIQFNNVSPYDGVYGGGYAGIYTGTVNGQAATFICDDFINEITYGQSWDANVNSSQGVTQNGNDNVRYAPSNQGQYDISNPYLLGLGLTQQQEYNMISWLVEQILNDPNNADGNWASYAGAIWSTADGGWKVSSYTQLNGGTETAQYFVQQAYENAVVNAVPVPTYTVYTPNGHSCTGCNSLNGQEFFSPNVIATPEPPLAVILGADLLLLGMAVVLLRCRGLLVFRG